MISQQRLEIIITEYKNRGIPFHLQRSKKMTQRGKTKNPDRKFLGGCI